MREIAVSAVADTVAALCVEANRCLPADVERRLREARDAEPLPRARDILDTLLDNAACARETGLPICQDTGLLVLFLDVGQDVHFVGGDVREALCEGVRRGVRDGYLRASVVSDPLRRVNTGDNTPPAVHLRIVPGDRVELTIAPKGFGSENCNALTMLNPGATAEEIVGFAADTMRRADGKPCPPVLLGVGLGGVSETCMEAARRALLRPAGQANPDPLYADLERQILAAVNGTGIGPQGMGGAATALAVHVEALPTHIAGLPCAVCVSCHAARHARIFI